MKYICNKCGFISHDEQNHIDHKEKCNEVNNETIKICDKCGYSCRRVYNYINHINNCSGVDNNTIKVCTNCGYMCEQLQDFIHHKTNCDHIDNINIKSCKYCGYKCRKIANYIFHIKYCSSLERECICGFKCASGDMYIKHKKNCLVDEKICINCGHKFRKIYYFDAHRANCELNMFTDTINNKIKIYVSLTSIPTREHNLTIAIKSLLEQTYLPDKIFITICEKYIRFPDKKFDYSVLDEYGDLIKIIKSPVDYGPITRVFGPYKELENDGNNLKYILLVDDDIKYNPKFIEDYINNVHNYNKYNKDFFIGQGFYGFSINYNMLNEFYSYYQIIVKENQFVFFNEDFILSSYFHLKNIPIKQIDINHEDLDGKNSLKYLRDEHDKNNIKILYDSFIKLLMYGKLDKFGVK